MSFWQISVVTLIKKFFYPSPYKVISFKLLVQLKNIYCNQINKFIYKCIFVYVLKIFYSAYSVYFKSSNCCANFHIPQFLITIYTFPVENSNIL